MVLLQNHVQLTVKFTSEISLRQEPFNGINL